MPDPAPRVAAIVLAGGSGTRLGLADGRNKVYVPLGDVPLLAWSLRTLGAHRSVDRLVVVIRPGDEGEAAAAIAAAGISQEVAVSHGGSTRTASETAGIRTLGQGRPDVDVVLVHDGARPFVDGALVDELIDAAARHGAAIPGVALEDDVVRVDPGGEVLPVAPGRYVRVQTPQAFRREILVQAFEAAAAQGIEGADTAELVAAAGGPPALVVEGDPGNLKVTRPGDVDAARRLARRRRPGGGPSEGT